MHRCDMPLGLEDKRVHNKMIRASSYYNYWCGPWSGRLNGRRHGRYGGAWCAKRRDRRQWLQIDFGALTKVYRIASQGRQNSAQWVKSYSLSYSKNGYKFITYKEGGRTKVFPANYDQHVIVRHRLRHPILGRYFRFHPITWYSWISMRVELYGCVVGARCNKPLGMQNGRIRAAQITASSSWDRNHAPNNGRLHLHRVGARMGAWCARHNNRLQWFQVNFGRPTRVVKFATQGRHDARQWVTQYYLTFSQDGAHYAEYKENSNRKYFQGNRDQNSVVQHRLFPRIKAQYIEIHPWGWYRHISMRVEFYGCAEDRCAMPLGLEDKRITDGHLTASTYYNHHLSPWHGRLNHRWSWSVRLRRVGQWFQVNFVELMRIKGVATQGRQDANQWVRSYTVAYSTGGMNFVSYKEGRTTKVFNGNTDRHSIVYHQFTRPFTAIHVRFYPRSWYSWISMRAEVYGCSAAPCNKPLGLQNRRLPDSRITASSEWNHFHAARLGRLGQVKHGRFVGAWCARHNNHLQWFKCDFGRAMKITKVATQGRQDTNQWVTSFYLSSSQDNVHWEMYKFRSAYKVMMINMLFKYLCLYGNGMLIFNLRKVLNFEIFTVFLHS
ncbi:uncharacterized protein LOC110068467 [Orbicella faveolata]|uniref:uncharacterized protein LOC110068467 n=1 Tax=Orbicella faveolata TaxID=48498 RepID=UPI0009E32587|nr:uncharacterized protein LOC110068467 [Orbicella faveolata]